MPKGKSKREKELLEMAAEQFARLFWKQWLYKKESEKLKKGNHKTNKNSLYINKTSD